VPIPVRERPKTSWTSRSVVEISPRVCGVPRSAAPRGRLAARVTLLLSVLFVAGCGDGSPSPTETNNGKLTALRWFVSQVIDGGRGVEVVAIYGGCDERRLDVHARETSRSIRLAISTTPDAERDRAGIECGAARTETLRVRLENRLNGRTVAGPGQTTGTFTEALQNSPKADYRVIPDVVGMQPSQATEALCRWGLKVAAPSPDGERVIAQRPRPGAVRPGLAKGAEEKYVDSIGLPCGRPPRAGSPVALTVSG
jgi:hypothetical protein